MSNNEFFNRFEGLTFDDVVVGAGITFRCWSNDCFREQRVFGNSIGERVSVYFALALFILLPNTGAGRAGHDTAHNDFYR